MKTRRIPHGFFRPILLAVLLTGCQRDHLATTVSIPDKASYIAWRDGAALRYGGEERRLVALAIQEIRMHIAAMRFKTVLSGTAGRVDVDDAIRAKINGMLVAEIIQYGLELKLARLSGEFEGLQTAIERNSNLTTKENDWESKQYLSTLRERQQLRLDAYAVAIVETETELRPLSARTGKQFVQQVTARPDVMPQRIQAQK